jgi:hypothetical protein
VAVTRIVTTVRAQMVLFMAGSLVCDETPIGVCETVRAGVYSAPHFEFGR